MTENVPTSAWGNFRPRGWRAAWLGMLYKLPPGAGWRRLALWLRKPLKKTLGDFVDVEVLGLKLRLGSRGNLSEQRLLLMPQFLDVTERTFLACKLKPGDVFLDIGANAGVYSLWVASRCGSKVRVEAFEPDSELCARLRFNLQTNGLSQVTLHECALGRAAGKAILIRGCGNRGENRIEEGDVQGQQVQVECLPDVLEKNGITGMKALKIDVEGFEVDVLSPLFEKAPEDLFPEVIVCELTPRVERAPLRELLARHGYRLEGRGRLNGIYCRTVTSRQGAK
jgi:FkbM family methyltransferase